MPRGRKLFWTIIGSAIAAVAVVIALIQVDSRAPIRSHCGNRGQLALRLPRWGYHYLAMGRNLLTFSVSVLKPRTVDVNVTGSISLRSVGKTHV
jgi:hypothetical protein